MKKNRLILTSFIAILFLGISSKNSFGQLKETKLYEIQNSTSQFGTPYQVTGMILDKSLNQLWQLNGSTNAKSTLTNVSKSPVGIGRISKAKSIYQLYYNSTTKEITYDDTTRSSGGGSTITSIPIDSVIHLQDSLTAKLNSSQVAKMINDSIQNLRDSSVSLSVALTQLTAQTIKNVDSITGTGYLKIANTSGIDITNNLKLNNLNETGYNQSVLSNGTITLTSSISGCGWLTCDSAGTYKHYAYFVFGTDAAVHLISNSSDISNTDAGNGIAIYDSGSAVIIRNRTGETKTIKIKIQY